MTTADEPYVNKYVVQLFNHGHGWQVFRLIARPEDLRLLTAQLSTAVDKYERCEHPAKVHDIDATSVWSANATRAFKQTARVQFEVLASSDLAPFHRPAPRRTLNDYSQVPLALLLGASVLVGLATMGYYAWQLVLWLQAGLSGL